MINFSLKDTIISNFIDRISKFCNKVFRNLMQQFNISQENRQHFQNIAILLISYSEIQLNYFCERNFCVAVLLRCNFPLVCGKNHTADSASNRSRSDGVHFSDILY